MGEVKYDKTDFKDKLLNMISANLYNKKSLFISKDTIYDFMYFMPEKYDNICIKSELCGNNWECCYNKQYITHKDNYISVYYSLCTKCSRTTLCPKCFRFVPYGACSKIKQKITLWLILRSQKFPKDIINLIIQKTFFIT